MKHTIFRVRMQAGTSQCAAHAYATSYKGRLIIRASWLECHHRGGQYLGRFFRWCHKLLTFRAREILKEMNNQLEELKERNHDSPFGMSLKIMRPLTTGAIVNRVREDKATYFVYFLFIWRLTTHLINWRWIVLDSDPRLAPRLLQLMLIALNTSAIPA